MLEGGPWKPERIVIIEFPDMSNLDAWYTSAKYQPLLRLRKEATSNLDMVIALEGSWSQRNFVQHRQLSWRHPEP
jgi:uncharacterized protein (DUF1330 family)